MQYSDDFKIVFSAIPKTGSRSVVDYLKTYLNTRKAKGTHTHYPIIPDWLKEYYAFTIVRNPFDRMVSYWWSTCKRKGGAGLDFEEFLTLPGGGIEQPYIMRRGFKRDQYSYIINNKFDRILRYENLEKEFSELPFFIKGTKLGWINPTVYERPPTEKLLTPKICKIIVRKFEKDFEILGYSMDYE